MPIVLHSRRRFVLANFVVALFAVAFISGCGSDPADEGQAAINSADSSAPLTPVPTGNDLAPLPSVDPPVPPEDGAPSSTTDSPESADTPATKNPTVAASEEAEDPPEEPRPATPKEEVYSAIDDALRRLRAKDYTGFVKYFMPVGVIRKLRDMGAMEQFVARIEREPESFGRFTDLLTKARKATPEFNKTSTEATLRIVEKPDEGKSANGVAEPKTTGVKLTGFGADLDVAVGKALAALAKGDIELFVTNMFPAGELRHPDADKRLAFVVRRMKANPAPIQQMIADLKAITGQPPVLTDAGSVASFRLEGDEITAGRREVKLPTRTFKFQKVENSWRLYDNTTAIRKEVAKQVKLPLPEFTPEGGAFVTLEKIGDVWRIHILSY